MNPYQKPKPLPIWWWAFVGVLLALVIGCLSYPGVLR